MGELTRPNRDEDPLPVQARRLAPDPRVIEAIRIAAQDGANPQPQPQPQPAPAPTVIVIQAGAPQQAAPTPPPAAPSPPPQVHYHTTVYHLPIGGAFRRRSVSAMGVVSVLLGLVACLAYWMPRLVPVRSAPIAATGLAFGALGFVTAILFRRTRAGSPFSGMLICLAALLLPLYSSGWLTRQLHRHAPWLPLPTAPKSAPAVEADPEASAPAPAIDPVLNARMQDAMVTLDAARHREEAAERAADETLEQNPNYQAAKQRVEATQTELKQVRQNVPAGTPERAAASQRWLDSVNALQRLRASLLADQPQVVAAQKDVAAAEARVESIRIEQDRSR